MATKAHCPFCDMAEFGKDSHDKDVLYQDKDVFIIQDLNPHAPNHFLIVPKRHINTANTLTSEDVELLQLLKAKALEFLSKKVTTGIDDDQLRMGFHCPPLVSVEHLHMHIIYPAKDMFFFFRNVMFRYNRFFRNVDELISELKKSTSVKDPQSPAGQISPVANSM